MLIRRVLAFEVSRLLGTHRLDNGLGCGVSLWVEGSLFLANWLFISDHIRSDLSIASLIRIERP